VIAIKRESMIYLRIILAFCFGAFVCRFCPFWVALCVRYGFGWGVIFRAVGRRQPPHAPACQFRTPSAKGTYRPTGTPPNRVGPNLCRTEFPAVTDQPPFPVQYP